MRKHLIIYLTGMVLLTAACVKDETESTETVDGYAPVYIPKHEAFLTSVSAPQSLTEPGKMYLLGNYVYITDVGKGVHIINNSNPSMPTKIKFISIPGTRDVAVKGNVLYADNLTDLVAFNISDPNNPVLVKRIKDLYPMNNQLYPDFATGYFECADTTKGYILRWEKKTLINPKCYR
jgi:hypothetical protein